MHRRPDAGARIIVQRRDGRQLRCVATLVVAGESSGVILYHRRRAIDEGCACGWWPEPKK
jgi:hypothetical protein